MGDRAAAICAGVLGLMLVATASLAQTPPASPPAASPPAASTTPAAPAAPPTSPADGEDARYSFNRVPDGYLRLDARTGQVAMCSRRQVGWACQLVPEDRLVLDSEIARLQSENGKLKRELLSRGLPLPSGIDAPPRPRATPHDDAQRSGREDLDRTLRALTAMWTRFVEMIANFTRDVMKKS
jgi:hypothetical protein